MANETPHSDFATLLATLLRGELADTVLENDIAIYFNIERINELYAQQIAQVKQLLPLILQQGQNNLPAEQLNTVKAYFESFIRSFEDTKGFAIAAEARAEGVNIRLDSTIKPKSPTADFLKDDKPTPLSGLMKLPKGYSTYTASRFGQPFVNLTRSIAELAAAPEDDKTSDAIQKYLDASNQSNIETFSVATDFTSVRVSTPKEPEVIAKTKLKAMTMMTPGAKYNNLVLKDPPKTKEADQKIGGYTLHKASLVIDFEESLKAGGDAAIKEAAMATMKKATLEKPNHWFGTDGKSYLEVTASDWDTAKAMIEKTLTDKNTVTDDKEVIALRKQLPAESTWFMLIDTSSVVNTLVDTRENLPDTPGLPGDTLPAMKKVKTKGTYIGTALTVKPSGVRFDTFLPTAAVKVMLESSKED